MNRKMEKENKIVRDVHNYEELKDVLSDLKNVVLLIGEKVELISMPSPHIWRIIYRMEC